MMVLLILSGSRAIVPETCIVRCRFFIAPRAHWRKCPGKSSALGGEVGRVATPSNTGVFAISVAAEMVSMEIQNLRVYERRGLIEPDRTAGGTRLYSPQDISGWPASASCSRRASISPASATFWRWRRR